MAMSFRAAIASLYLLLGPFEMCLQAQMDYFPDFPVLNQDGSLGVSVGLSPSFALTNATDLEAFPDPSGRMLGLRGFNRVYMLNSNGTGGPYLQVGPTDVANAEGSTAIAFHPGFADPASPGYAKFYAITVDVQASGVPDFVSGGEGTFSHSVLVEVTMNDISVNSFAGARIREVMRFHESQRVHNVGDIDFGLDGAMYISLGEDLQRQKAQDLSSVYGKILRIDPLGSNSANGRYGIPSDNPFVGTPSVAAEVYAYGFRNAHRINFDPTTGDLFAADLGEDSIEEVSRVEAGGNYGWPLKEGSFIFGSEVRRDEPDPVTGLTLAQELGLTDPLFEYDHTDGNAILGGAIYRGTEIPWLVGKYLAADWSTGKVWVGDPATGELGLLFPADYVYGNYPGARIKSVEADQFGEVHLVGMSDNIYRLTALPDACDFSGDGICDVTDLDMLLALGPVLPGVSSEGNEQFDLNGDGTIDLLDRDQWLEKAATKNGFLTSYKLGDANLDGFVDISDRNIWNGSKFTATLLWSAGDFNGDGAVDASDFNLWNANKYSSSDGALVIPEPALNMVLTIAFLTFGLLKRIRRN